MPQHLPAPVAILSFSVLWACFCAAPPSDEQLLRNFDRHEQEFEQLVEMMREDPGLERVDVDWTRPDDPASIGVTPERIARYRQWLGDLGVERCFYAFHDADTYSFVVKAGGTVYCGWSKGYEYSPRTPEMVVENLDELRRGWEAEHGFWAHRRIRGDWYLYEHYDP